MGKFDHKRGGGGYRGRGGRRRGRHPTSAAESGNERERISVESGALVLIDQFMLANPQLIEQLNASVDSDAAVKDKLIRDYGGTVVSVEPGTYRIDRDPFKYTIVIHPENEEIDRATLKEKASQEHGQVFVDTRCLAMIDRELLDDSDLLDKYQQLWFSGQDKACRDLLRDNGGAVRYGFQRHGDELGVYAIPESSIVCLWPDIIEGDETSESQVAA